MFLPIVGVEVSAFVLVLIGFTAGVLGGFFGIGGGFMVTPALNIFGFSMAYAIGTDLAHVMGNSIVATFKHRKLGNVDVKLGAMMILGTALGVWMGKEVILYMERAGLVESVVRAIYILLLWGIGLYMMVDYFKFVADQQSRHELGERIGTVLSHRIHDVHLPPMVRLNESGISSVSIWAILLVGFVTGFLAGFLGVGGGFIRMPALIYALGVPTTVAIGTDLFEIIFSAGIGAFLYALEGKVEIAAAAVMLLGAAVGAQLGTIATRYVKGMKIRLYFAVTVLFAGVSVLLKQLGETYANESLNNYAAYLILSTSAAMSALVILGLIKGAIVERQYRRWA